MCWGLFGQIVLLILINAVIMVAIKCIHDSFCIKCKK